MFNRALHISVRHIILKLMWWLAAAAAALPAVIDSVDTLTGGKEHRARNQSRFQQSLNEESEPVVRVGTLKSPDNVS